ncbi:Transcription factor sdnS [Lachnellula cervina]|uniref:Transcription factor sdnS n=1 Tax=Lachnellula cervina TaxID=1316786 RepID=A0A7D8YTC0_9HELO|nr:Transcription factor sdnS [Lachnellula cervina]
MSMSGLMVTIIRRAIAPWVLDILPEKYPETLSGFVTFALSSNDPSLVGLGLLSIAASIQQLDSNHEHILRQLPSPQADLFYKYLNCVDALILNDSYYASSMVGLGVGVLAAKLLMNLGLIRKAWLLIHRSISYGQILGLQSQQRSQTEPETVISRRERTWSYLCELDLYISLLIGLPYAAISSTMQTDRHVRQGTTSWFQSRLLKLATRTIDRNQAGLELSSILSQDLHRDAELAAYEMDRNFWDAPAELMLQRIDRSEYMERITSQLWYHHICVFIHMPLMIQSIEDPALENHRTACLAGSREALKTYHIMRSDPLAAFKLEKLIDYQTFICATLLLLGKLGSGFLPNGSEQSHYDRDWELIESTLEILRRVSTTSNNLIAAQALQGLETLASLARNFHLQHGKCQTPSLKIVVPFSGTITIFPGSSIKCSRDSSAQSLNVQPLFTLSNGFNNEGENQYPSIDFSWDNMIGMTTEDNWAWLPDLSTT